MNTINVETAFQAIKANKKQIKEPVIIGTSGFEKRIFNRLDNLYNSIIQLSHKKYAKGIYVRMMLLQCKYGMLWNSLHKRQCKGIVSSENDKILLMIEHQEWEFFARIHSELEFWQEHLSNERITKILNGYWNQISNHLKLTDYPQN